MVLAQPGIFAQGTRSHYHLEFELAADAEPADVLLALAPLRQPSVSAGGANIVVGFGPVLWRQLVGPDAVPEHLGPFPVIGGVPVSQHDLWVWIHGTGTDEVLEVALGITRLLSGVARVAAEVAGFVYHDSRDLTGFVDGTENPAVEEAFEVATVPADRPGAGGSFALLQRWIHDLGRFHALPVDEQEGVIGRTKLDSVELDDDVKPDTAHIARVVIEENGEELEIYRRSVPFGTTRELGLQFVAFSADPGRYERMLNRMFGHSDDGLHDRLTEFSRPASSAYYFVPSLDDLGSVLG